MVLVYKLTHVNSDLVDGERVKLACTTTVTPTLLSPPLFKPSTRANLAMVSGYPHDSGAGSGQHDGSGHQEDEWKNIKVVMEKIKIKFIKSLLQN